MGNTARRGVTREAVGREGGGREKGVEHKDNQKTPIHTHAL